MRKNLLKSLKLTRQKTAAIGFLNKILEIDPANEDAKKNIDILQKASKGGSSKGGSQASGNSGGRQ
jgi:hypothetical protein